MLAETWRIVDKLFVDRTFNGLDWFAAPQDVLKKRYASPDDAYARASSSAAWATSTRYPRRRSTTGSSRRRRATARSRASA